MYPTRSRHVTGRGVMGVYISRPPYRELGQVPPKQIGLDTPKLIVTLHLDSRRVHRLGFEVTQHKFRQAGSRLLSPMERPNLGKSCVLVERDNLMYTEAAFAPRISYPLVTSAVTIPRQRASLQWAWLLLCGLTIVLFEAPRANYCRRQ